MREKREGRTSHRLPGVSITYSRHHYIIKANIFTEWMWSVPASSEPLKEDFCEYSSLLSTARELWGWTHSSAVNNILVDDRSLLPTLIWYEWQPPKAPASGDPMYLYDLTGTSFMDQYPQSNTQTHAVKNNNKTFRK